MDYLIIYKYSLCVALTLMLFFGIYFLTAPTPEKPIFDNYLRSRRIMGIAILILAANYFVHFFYGIRFVNIKAAISMNLPRAVDRVVLFVVARRGDAAGVVQRNFQGQAEYDSPD